MAADLTRLQLLRGLFLGLLWIWCFKDALFMVTGLGFTLASRFSYIPAPLSYPYSNQIYVSQDHHAFVFSAHPLRMK
ncbi:hypothetical protein C8J56DRAFT_1060468 [Mycena floridula]|nr:hypothetical protein C8J56DRAFT_1060468 [Mycena floridula]